MRCACLRVCTEALPLTIVPARLTPSAMLSSHLGTEWRAGLVLAGKRLHQLMHSLMAHASVSFSLSLSFLSVPLRTITIGNECLRCPKVMFNPNTTHPPSHCCFLSTLRQSPLATSASAAPRSCSTSLPSHHLTLAVSLFPNRPPPSASFFSMLIPSHSCILSLSLSLFAPADHHHRQRALPLPRGHVQP